MTKRVFIVNSDHLYNKMFKDRGWELVDNIYDADLVQFTGGEDVDPSMYKSQRHPTTFSNPNRDAEETGIYELAQELGLPCAGICRGGQLLNVLNGGSMYQNVDNHGRSGGHEAFLPGPIGYIHVSSTHHQMMIPNEKAEHLVLLAANEAKIKEKMDGKITVRTHMNPMNPEEDCEAVYYHGSNSLCFQPHPEYSGYEKCQDAYFYFINNYLFNNYTIKEIEDDLYINVLGGTAVSM